MPARPLVAAAASAAALAGVLTAAPASAAGDTVLSGRVAGADGRAVGVLLGFDLKDGEGRTLGASGCVRSPSCPVDGYALTRRLNFHLDATGSSRGDRTWSVSLPAQARRVYVDAYPQGRGYAGTSHRRYAAGFRRNLPVPSGGPVELQLPLVCGVSRAADRPGAVYGRAVGAGGERVALERVTAYSMEPDDGPTPVLGLGLGVVRPDGSYRVSHLATGGRAGDHDGQRYQLIATAVDGRVRRVFDVPVTDCRGVRRDLRF